jgi:hypothetical protein
MRYPLIMPTAFFARGPFAVAGRLAVLVLLTTTLGAAEARLELPDPLTTGTTMQGALVVEGSAEVGVRQVVLPEVPGLEWQVQRGSSKSVSIINGKVTASESVFLALRATTEGRLAIGPVKVTLADGSTIVTKPTTVTVGAAPAALTGEARAEAAFEPATIVPGEPASLVYRVYLRRSRSERLEIDPKKLGVAPPPGCIALGDGKAEAKDAAITDATGASWRVFTFHWQLTAAKPGAYEVGGQQEYYLCEQDFFGRLTIAETRQLAVKPATLTVTPLPHVAVPEDFTGLCGPITVSAKLERDTIIHGESTVLELKVQGRQVELLTRPKLDLPPGLQAYAKEEPAANPGSTDQEGRVFRWDLVPGAPGDYAIPPIAFTYFDPAGRNYARAGSKSLSLTVVPGKARDLTVTGAPIAAPDQGAPTGKPGAATTPSVMPTPLRGAAPSRPDGWLALQLLALALVMGVASGLIGRWLAREPVLHRGRQLAQAVRSGDLDAIARALQALTPVLATDAQRQAAADLTQAVDTARFGRARLDQAEAGRIAATLADVA